VSLHRDGLHAVRTYGVPTHFAQERETVSLQVSYEVAPLYGQLDFDRNLLEQSPSFGDFLALLSVGEYHLTQSVLEEISTFIKCTALCNYFGPFH